MKPIPVVAPLYFDLDDHDDWDRVYRFPPQVAVLFLERPTAALDEGWAGKVAKLRSIGTAVVGFIDLDDGNLPIYQLIEEMTGWAKYRGLSGFFFDRPDSEPDFVFPAVAMTSTCRQVACSPTTGKNIFNMGGPWAPTTGLRRTGMERTWFVTFEDTAANYLLHPDEVQPGIHLVHSCPTEQAPAVFDAADKYGATGLYVTPNVPPRPWRRYHPQAVLAKGQVVTW